MVQLIGGHLLGLICSVSKTFLDPSFNLFCSILNKLIQQFKDSTQKATCPISSVSVPNIYQVNVSCQNTILLIFTKKLTYSIIKIKALQPKALETGSESLKEEVIRNKRDFSKIH